MGRLDTAMVQRNLAASRQRAKEFIQQGNVQINGVVCTKAARNVTASDNITITADRLAYVGRGGLKLEHALRLGFCSLKDAVCMDIGASTGGFTDCMLQNGAAKVYAVDVGHDQLATRLRQDSRVINLEKTDIRMLKKSMVSEPIDFISVDVSFISLRLIIPEIVRFLKPNGIAVFLIKPQFEAGRDGVGKHGLVRSKVIHEKVLQSILSYFTQCGLSLCSLCPSPIRGGSGNIEYLAIVQHNMTPSNLCSIPEIVKEAFA